jgi:hypothetical protein
LTCSVVDRSAVAVDPNVESVMRCFLSLPRQRTPRQERVRRPLLPFSVARAE